MKVKDIVSGILAYPLYLMGYGFVNSFVDLLVVPIYLSILRMRGIIIFEEIDPDWSFGEIRKYANQVEGEQ